MSSEASKSLLPYSALTSDQEDAIDRLYEDNCLLIAAKGFGKCVVAQTAAQELLNDGELKRVLVIAPLKVSVLTWGTEWQKWEHLEEIALAVGEPKQRELAIASSARIVIINIENVPWLIDTYGAKHGFDGLIIDEISKFKAAGTRGVKKLRHRTGDFKWRVGLSATPLAESGQDIYSQALLIDGGKALGKRFERFQRTYFMQMDYSGYKWSFQPGGEERLAAALGPLVYVADNETYEAELPPFEDVEVEIELPAAVMEKYEDAAASMLLGEREIPNMAVLSGKLQQITQGAYYDEDGVAHWLHWEKFETLIDLIEEIDAPVAVCYQYRFELDYLRGIFPEAGVLAEDPEYVESMWNAGRMDVILVHPKSAAHGLNLQYGGCELVMLGPVWSADDWDQVAGRLWRRGQTDIVTRHTIVARGTVDGIILDRLDGKSDAEDSIMEHIRAVAQKKNPA